MNYCFWLLLCMITSVFCDEMKCKVRSGCNVNGCPRSFIYKDGSFPISCKNDGATTTAALKALLPKSCEDVDIDLFNMRGSNGGMVRIYPPGLGAIDVYCDIATDGGGWTVFQRRMDGSQDFYRGWHDYRYGFGYLRGEFWLGLNDIHALTKNDDYELRVDMLINNGTYVYAKYSTFSVGSLKDRYKLSVGGYSGNATDALAAHDGMLFSTKDVDHDTDFSGGESCAQFYKGGWWYASCYSANLNGLHGNRDNKGIGWWYHSEERMVMLYTEMKFRRKKKSLSHFNDLDHLLSG